MADGVSRPEERVSLTDDHADRGTVGQLSLGRPATLGHAERTPHAEKFLIVKAGLVAVAAVAVAVVVLVLTQGSSPSRSSETWSAWSPLDSGSLGATEIAEHVAPLYRVTSAQQLDVVTLIRLADPSDVNATTGSGYTVAVSTSGSTSTQNLSLLGGSTIAYDICGIGGSGCALGGAPSNARLLLLRREALELALYTFRYLSGPQYVIAVLPPGRTQATTSSALTQKPPAPTTQASPSKPITLAVLFDRAELQPWLNEPLASTLTAYPPAISALPNWAKTTEAGLVDQITERGLFSESLESEQDGGRLLVLSALPPA